MKTIYLLITCLLIQWGVFAQEGVNFRNLTFNEALAQAKENGIHGLLHLLVRAMQKHDQQRVPTKSGRRLFQPSFRLCKI